MDTATSSSPIVQRALDLCQVIVEQPDFLALKSKVDAFLDDEPLKFRYQQLNDLTQLLQMKQSDGLELKPDEIAEYESLRAEFLGNATAQGFLEAQQQFHQLHQAIGKLIDKTIELGRKPTDDDLQDGTCCGGGCGGH